MSGLVRFFRSFLPSHEVQEEGDQEGGDADNEESTSQSQSEPAAEGTGAAYRESLSTVRTSLSLPVNIPATSQVDDFSDEEEDTTCTYQEWRLRRNQMLTKFVLKRLADDAEDTDEDEDDTEAEPVDDQHDEDDMERLETQQLNTQQLETQQLETQQLDPVDALDRDTTPTQQVRRRAAIPHVDDTLHHVTTVSGMDLQTQSLSLQLAKVERIWRCRETRRFEELTCSRAMPRHLDPTLPLPFFPFGDFEDDGPLQTVFKTVLSMEVTQLDDPDREKIRQASLQAFDAKLYRRVKIFLHNKYATAVQDFIDQGTNTAKMMISLKKIPAKCIFPYHANRESFVDQDIAKYCIVVGDKSSLKLMQPQTGLNQKIHFQDDDMEIRFARWDVDGSHAEIVLNFCTVKGQGESGVTTERTLTSIYDGWVDLHQKDQRKMAPVAAAEAEQQPASSAIVAAAPEKPVAPPTAAASPAAARATRTADETNAGPSPKRLKKMTRYHKLSELEDAYSSRMDGKFLSVNVIGIVLGFGAPNMTRRNQWMISLSIVDDTLPLPGTTRIHQDEDLLDEGIAVITVCVFANHREDLPDVHQAGDVLHLNCVGVQLYNNQIQLLASRGRGASLTVIRPKEKKEEHHQEADGEWQYDASPASTYDGEVVDRFVHLWKWGQKRMLSHPSMKASARFRIEDVGRIGINGETGMQDCTVMVVSMFASPEGNDAPLPRGFLRIWDGTGASQSDKLPLATAEANEAVLRGEPTSAVIGRMAAFIQEMEKGAEDPIEPPKSLCGKVVNIGVWEDPHWDLVKKTLRPGKFVRMRNVSQGQLYNGLQVLFAQSKSWLTPLPDKTYEARQLLLDHSHRVRRREPFNPQCGVMPFEGSNDILDRVAAVTPPPGAVVAPPSLTAVAPSVVAVRPTPQTDEKDAEVEVPQESEETPSRAGLGRCISEPAPQVFTVRFRITRFSPNSKEKDGLRSFCADDVENGGKIYRLVVHLEDGNTEIEALSSDAVGRALFGMDAGTAYNLNPHEVSTIMKSIHQPNRWWSGDIHSVEMKGKIFFVLQSISDPTHASV
jgi:hypothetical protein